MAYRTTFYHCACSGSVVRVYVCLEPFLTVLKASVMAYVRLLSCCFL